MKSQQRLVAALATALVLAFPAPPVRGQSPHPCGAVPTSPPSQSWSFIGPTAIINGQTDNGRTTVNGRINSVAVNPHTPDSDVWVATAGGGVWHLLRGGQGDVLFQQWTPMTDDQESLATGALALDSCTIDRCATVWAGGGENSIRRDTQYGAGVLRGRWNVDTLDYDWAQLGAEHFRFGSISALVLDPSTPDNDQKTVYVGLTSGVTADATHSTVTTHPAGAYGIWKSTDAGASWSLVFSLAGARAGDLEIDPQDPQTLYASFERQGLWRSTDGGMTWETMVNGIPTEFVDHASWPELAVHRPSASAPAVLYVTMVGEGGCPPPHSHVPPHGCNPALFRSDDGGDSWQMMLDKGEDLATYETYLRALAIHPSDPQKLWFGGLGFNQSENGGADWTTHYGAHPDHHDIEIWEDPTSPTGVRMYVVGDGGIYLTDGAGNWDDSPQDGLGVTLFQSISATPHSEHLIGGLQDNGTNYYWVNHLVWDHINDGAAASTIMDSDDPSTFYDVYIGNAPRRCTDAPFGCDYDWPEIKSGIGGGAVAFYPPLIEDPTAIPGPQHPLYFGNQTVRHSVDDGSSWSGISSVSLAKPTGPDVPPPPFFKDINSTNVMTAIAPAPTDPAWLYIGFYDGRIWRTANADQNPPTWTRVDGNSLPDRPVTSIAVHPIDREEVYVAFNGFGEHSVYRSLDAGGTWQAWDQTIDASTVLAERPANRLAIEPVPPYRAWLGTDACVYSRPTGSAAGWQYAGQGMPNVAVYDFAIDPDRERIYAGTHGRGVWKRDLGDADTGLVKIFNYEKCCAFWIDTGDPPGPPLHDPAAYVAVSAVALEPDAACTLRLERLDGSVCAEAEVDADGGSLRTDEHGALVADKEGFYTGKPAAWACYDGLCAGDVPVDDCDVASVTVTCGGSETRSDAVAPKVTADPGSALLALTPTLAPGTRGVRSEGRLALTPSLATAGEAGKALCTVEVAFDETTAPAALLEDLARAVERDGDCIVAGVTAEVLAPEPSEGEDAGLGEPALRLRGASLEGSQLVPAITDALGARVELRGLGLPQHGQPVAPRLSLSAPEGAAGGILRVTEVTPFGRCTMAVETGRGEDETTIAERLQARFLAPPDEDPEAAVGCPNRRNLRDAARRGASLQFPLAHGLIVETDDPGLSFRLDSQ